MKTVQIESCSLPVAASLLEQEGNQISIREDKSFIVRLFALDKRYFEVWSKRFTGEIDRINFLTEEEARHLY